MRCAFRSRFRLSGLLAVVLALAACSGEPDPGGAEPSPTRDAPVIQPSGPFTEVVELEWRGPEGTREELMAWVADTPEKRGFGLMNRTELPEQAGMLFVFAQDGSGGFWMKNTLIPLSIAYLSADAEVLAVLDMEPCQAEPCPVYDPGTPYRYAVETNQGWFQRRGVGPGWRLAGDLPAAGA